jgi:hypothetical protein
LHAVLGSKSDFTLTDMTQGGPACCAEFSIERHHPLSRCVIRLTPVRTGGTSLGREADAFWRGLVAHYGTW